MKLTFYGAVREVTGSMHLLSHGDDKILLDCGMFQGRRKVSNEKNQALPVNPRQITNIVLSHAHIDHSGRIPFLTKNGFNGRIVCTRATADACEYLLLNSAYIQESDARYLNYKTVRRYFHEESQKKRVKKGKKRDLKDIKKMLKKSRHELDNARINEYIRKHNLQIIQPLYNSEEAEAALKQFRGYPYQQPVTIGKEMTVKFYEAGHILGSAFCLIKIHKDNRDYNICYTGDAGRFGKPILQDPTLVFAEEDRRIDLMIMESTYGNRFHEPVKDLREHLRKAIVETHTRGGSVIIPSFAFGRTQELIYFLHELYRDGEVPHMPVYVDSPLATSLTKVFGEHPEVLDKEAHASFLEKGENPFTFKNLNFVSSVEESMALMHESKPHIVIAGSGMCEAGRVLHHLRYKIHNARNTILVVGFMAANTLGRRILDFGTEYAKAGRKGPPPTLKFMDKRYPLAAHVVVLGGFSAHADQNELTRILSESNLEIKQVALVHGEEDGMLILADHLGKQGFSVAVPKPGETLAVEA